MAAEQSAKAKEIIDGAKSHADLKKLAKDAGVPSYIGKSAQETRKLLHQLVRKLSISHQQTDF